MWEIKDKYLILSKFLNCELNPYHNSKLASFFFLNHCEAMDLNIFEEFQSVALRPFKAKSVLFLLSRNPFNLASESFSHEPSSFLYLV